MGNIKRKISILIGLVITVILVVAFIRCMLHLSEDKEETVKTYEYCFEYKVGEETQKDTIEVNDIVRGTFSGVYTITYRCDGFKIVAQGGAAYYVSDSNKVCVYTDYSIYPKESEEK